MTEHNLDLEQFRQLLKSLKIDSRQMTDSEKELRKALGIHETSTAYYLENIQVVNTLLKCCVRKNEANQTKVDKDIFKNVYELLRNDLYNLKLSEIKRRNIRFTDIDQIEFFAFLNNLYSDQEFINSAKFEDKLEKNNKKELLLLETNKILEEITQSYLSANSKESLNAEKSKKIHQNLVEEIHTSESIDNQYRMLEYLVLAEDLKNIYLKDSKFTIAKDVDIIHQMMFKDSLDDKMHTATSAINAQQLRRLITNALSTTTAAATYFLIESFLPEATPKIAAAGLSAFVYTAALDAFSRHFGDEQISSEMNHNLEVLEAEYNLKKNALLEKCSIELRYDNESFDELKRVLATKLPSQISLDDVKKCSRCFKYLSSLDKKLKELDAKFEHDLDLIKSSSATYVNNLDDYEKYENVLKHFQHFEKDDIALLVRMLNKNDEHVRELDKFIETAETFGKSLSVIKDFKELSSRINAKVVQKTLQNSLNDALQQSSQIFQKQHALSV